MILSLKLVFSGLAKKENIGVWSIGQVNLGEFTKQCIIGRRFSDDIQQMNQLSKDVVPKG